MKLLNYLLITACLSISSQLMAQTSISNEIQDLKQQMIALNRDLFLLEEDLLYPASTQVVVYVSMDVGKYFELDAIELKIDGDTMTHYLYTKKQIAALLKGGVQRLHMGNINQGEHEITVFVLGKGPEGREVKRGTTKKITKTQDAKAIELKIRDSSAKEQAMFELVEL